MSVEGEFVTQFFPSSFAFGCDVIYLYEIPWSKVEFTPSTFSLLLLQESCERPFKHWVMFESLAPIKHVSVVWAGFSIDLCVTLNTRCSVLSDFLLFWG